MSVRTAPVTVIVPCYRCAETVQRAVASIHQQTLRPLEVVLVEDGSDDATNSALASLKEQHGEWLRIVQLPTNRGPSVARNAGWEIASQPYVAFLDADDGWHPRKIEIQYEWMKEHPEIALTAHECRVINSNHRERPPECSTEGRWDKIESAALLFSNCVPTPSVMLRCDLPYRFQPEKRYSEDYLLWLEITHSGHLAYRSNLSLAYWYKAPYGEGGLSGNLLDMERGELDTYRRLYRSGHIGLAVLPPLYIWSLIRFGRRLLLTTWRRMGRSA